MREAMTHHLDLNELVALLEEVQDIRQRFAHILENLAEQHVNIDRIIKQTTREARETDELAARLKADIAVKRSTH